MSRLTGRDRLNALLNRENEEEEEETTGNNESTARDRLNSLMGDDTPANAESKATTQRLLDNGYTSYHGNTYTLPEPEEDTRSLWERTADFITSRRGEASLGAVQESASDMLGLWRLIEDWGFQSGVIVTPEEKRRMGLEDGETPSYIQDYDRKIEDLQGKSQQHIENAKQGLGKVGQTLVDVGAQTTQMAIDNLAGMISGTGMAPFAARAFGGGAQEARENGGNLTQQTLYGAAQMAKEVATEKLFGLATPFKTFQNGSADDIVNALITSVSGRVSEGAARTLVKAALTGVSAYAGEFSEEAIGNIIEWATQMKRIYGGDPGTLGEALKAGIQEGNVAGLSALFGAPLGGALDARARNQAAVAEYGRTPTDRVANVAASMPDSKTAQKAQRQLEAGKNLSGRTVGNLAELYERAMISGDVDAIKTATANRLRQLGETGDVDAISSAIARTVSGKGLGSGAYALSNLGFITRAERSAISESKYGTRVLNELDPDNILSQTYDTGWAENIGTEAINPMAYTLMGQAKTAAEAAETERRKTQPIEPRQGDLEYEESPESSLTGNETVDGVLRKAFTTEISSNDVRGIVENPEAMTALQNAVGTIELKGKSSAEQRDAVRKAVTQYAAQNRPAERVTMTKVPTDIASIAKQYGNQESAVRSIYNMAPTSDMQGFSTGMMAAYRIGFDGGDMAAALTSTATQSLTEDQRRIAYATGKDARDAGYSAPVLGNNGGYGKRGVVRARGMSMKEINRRFKHGSNQKDAVSVLRAIAEATGFTIELFDSAGDYTMENGSFDWSEDVIRIDINAGINTARDVESLAKYTLLRTFSHELTHAGEKWAPSEYSVLRAAVFEALSSNADYNLNERIQKVMTEQGLSWDYASREVVADAMTDVLPESRFMETLLKKDPSVARKLANALKDFISRIQNYFKDIVSNPNREAQALKVEVDGSVRYMKGIVEKWDAMIVAASENFKRAVAEQEAAEAAEAERKRAEEEEKREKPEKATAADITREGIESVTDQSGKKMFQLRTMKQDLDGYMDDLRSSGLVGDGKVMSEQDLTDLYNSINTVMNYVEQHLDEIERSESFRNMDGTNRPFLPYKENSDPHYKMALDYSTLCRKRLLTQAITERLQAALGRAVKPVEQVKIRNEIKKLQEEGKKIDVACALCYVEAARLKSPKVINEFLDNRSASLKNYFSLKNSRFKKEVYEKRRGDWKEAKGLDRNATKDQIKAAGFSVAAFNRFSIDIRDEYWSWLEQNQPDMYQKQSEIIRTAEGMDASEFLNAKSLARLRLNMPELYDAFISKVRSATRSKAQETDVPYKRGDINSVGDAIIEQMNEESGFRHQSWSDFQAMHLLDTVSAVIELATRGAKVHTYTKVADMVRFLGLTNMAINMSLIPAGETGLKADGSLDFDPVEGIDFDTMVQLRDEFHATAGNIAIGITDDQIRAMMASPFIDYIIPYHTSGLNADMRKRMGIRAWKDYTKWQNEAGGAGPGLGEWFNAQEGLRAEDGVDYMVEASKKYLELCHERGVTPKFPQFLTKQIDGRYALAPDAQNYWKLLIDRKMVDQITRSVIIQKPVIPKFDTDTILDILSKEVDSESVRDAKEAEDKIVKMLLSGDVVFTKQELAQARALRDVAVRQAIESTAAEAEAPQRQLQRRIEAPEGLTPEQQKNFNINQNQTETGSLLKTLAGTTIKRFNDTVGKNLGTVANPQVYFNRQYASDIVPEDVISRAESIMRDAGLDPDDFRCAMWDKAKNIYRFDESPDFDTAREPIPGRQVTVDLNNGAITRDKYSSDIWHHKWLWVENDYQGFDVSEAWNWSKTYLSMIRPVAPSKHSFSNNKATDTDYVKKGSFAQRGIADAGIWNEQLDYFGLPRDKSPRAQYSLRLVEPVQPTNGGWERTHTTQEAMDAAAEKGIRMWDVSADYANEKNPTSMTLAEGGTTLTYRKVFNYLGDDYSGRILDASSGQGYGTRIGQEMGYDIEDIEPYPDDYNYQFIKGTDEESVITLQQTDKKTGKLKNVKRTVNKTPRHPKYMDYSELDDMVSSGEIEPFDFIISNAVLNVVPQDQRDALVAHMGHLLAPGGQMFVNVRKIDEIRKLGDNQKNAKLGDHEAVESTGGSYQYGFGNSEIVDYLRDALGEGFTVVDGRKIFGTSSPTALVKKAGGTRVEKQLQARQKLSEEAERFASEIDEWDRNGREKGKSFILGSTGSVLQGLGAIESDVYMLSDKINLIIEEHPEMSVKDIKSIPEILENPVLVMASKNASNVSNNSRITMFGMPKAQNGIPIMVVFDLIPIEGHISIQDMQKVVNAYTKNRSRNATRNFIQSSEILYADKEKAASLLHSAGFQYAYRIEQSGYVGRITYNDYKVNLEGKDFSEVFSEPMQYSRRDSVATDSDYMAAVEARDMETAQRMVDEAAKAAGYTRKAFHQTNAKHITVFDLSIGTNGGADSETPYGVFTKRTKADIGLGENQMALYVRPGKTLRFRNREELHNYFGGEYKSILDEIDRIDERYSAEYDDAYERMFDLQTEFDDNHPEIDVMNMPLEEFLRGDYYTDPDVRAAMDRCDEIKREWNDAVTKLRVRAKGVLTNLLKSEGYDSVEILVDNGSKGRSTDAFISLDNRAVKSADPVTYDDNGNVIPLSERFQRENSDIRYQRRQQSYTDREVLELAADVLDSRKLTDGERAALDIFNKRLDALRELEEQRDDQRRILEDQKNEGADAGEIRKTKNRLSLLGKKIKAAENAVLTVQDKQVLKKVLHEARRVVEREQRKIVEVRGDKKKHIARIKETTLKLSAWLQKNSDKEHVPEVLKRPLTDFLSTLDFSSTRLLNGGEMTKEDRKFSENLVKINSLISGQQDAIDGRDGAIDNVGAYLDISPENREFLNGLVGLMAANSSGSFTLNEMNVEQLKALDKFMRNLAAAISKANKALANARYQSIPAMARESMGHFEDMGKARSSDGTKLSRFLKWTNTTPYYAFKRFGEAGKSLFDGFSRGWEQLAKNAQEIIDFTKETYKPSEVRAWKKEIHNITLEDGSRIQMTTGQIMALTQLFQRPQAMQHIQAGGIRVGTIQQGRSTINDTKHYHLSLGDMQKLNDLLTDRQKEVAKKLRSWMGQRGEEWGNEISMARFGYEFYTEGEGYFPIKTDDNVRPMKDTDDAQNASMFRLLNLSFSKSLNPHASNALVVDDIFDTFADHMSDMAKLHALGLPLLDAIKWYNYTERINGEGAEYSVRGLKGSMEEAFGSAAGSYFKTLLKDINGAKEARDRGNFDLTSNYKIAAVGANLRVAFLQPTSYIRAMAVLNPKYMLSAFASKNAYQEALQYSGTAVWKSLGYYDTDIARSLRSQIENDDTWLDKVKEGSMTLAEIGDQRTWGRLWVACKMQTKAENPELTGEDLKVKTADLFREVIYATQVMDSTLTRSEIMRGTTKWDKLKTAFMSEPTLSLNLIMDSFSQFSIDRRKTNTSEALQKNSGHIARAFVSYVSSAALSALVESLVDAARDDDDYETFLQKFNQAFFGENGFLTGNLGQDLTILGKIPLVKDIINTVLGNSSSDMSVASIEAITNSYNIWRETIQLANGTLDAPTKVTYNGNMTDWGKIYKTLQALSQLTGIAVSNLTRDAVAIWNVIMPDRKIKTYQPKTATAIRTSGVNGFLTPEQAYDEMVEAGADEDDAEKLRDQIRFIRSGKVFDDISESAAHGYYSYAESAGIDTQTYYSAWKATKSMAGEDADGDGTTDSYSKLDKQLAYIDAMNLTRQQKYALANALTGAAEKTILKRANFH